MDPQEPNSPRDWGAIVQQVGALIQGIGCIIILIPLVIVCVVVLWAVAC